MRLICFIFKLTLLLMALESNAKDFITSPHKQFEPDHAQYVQWTFSGVANGEDGTQYGYFFQVQKNGLNFTSQATLFDMQTKMILLQDSGHTVLSEEQIKTHHYRIQNSFLQYIPVSESWIFGFRQANKSGFNFKVHLLSADHDLASKQTLRRDMSALVIQAHALNGHVNLPVKDSKDIIEQFVTAKSAWFRELSSADQAKFHPVKTVLCRFSDESGLYSINLPESDAYRAAIAGQFNSSGQAVPMSQFVDVHAIPEDSWSIQVFMPNEHITVMPFIRQEDFQLGSARLDESSTKFGFCVLSEDTFGITDHQSVTV